MDPRIVAGVSIGLLAIFLAVDLRDAAFRASWSSDRRRLRRNAAFLVANIATMLALNAVTHVVDAHAPKLFTWSGPLAVEVVACLVVAELINWVSHWLKHKVAWLWTFHLQHHVEDRYSINLTLHTHGVEVVVSGAAMAAVLCVCGFSRFSVDVFTLSYFGANLYKHCTARFTLGPLDWLFVAPAYHRMHHARGHEGNYGSVLTIFDVLFRTATFPRMDDAFARPLGVNGDEPFGFVDEMLAPVRPLSARRPSSTTAG